MLINGVEIENGNKISFRTKHRYDTEDHVGIFVGFVHYEFAKARVPEIPTYYQKLNFDLIPNAVRFDQLNYVVIQKEDKNFFAAAPEWITEGSLKKISNKYKDIRIIGIEDSDDVNRILQMIRDEGFSVELK